MLDKSSNRASNAIMTSSTLGLKEYVPTWLDQS